MQAIRVSLLLATIGSTFVIMPAQPPVIASTIPASAKVGLITAGAAVAQFHKDIAKNYIKSFELTNSLPQVIARGTTNILLTELAKRCITAMLPQTMQTSADLGMRSIVAFDLYKAVAEAIEAFPPVPTQPSIPGPRREEPFHYAPAVIEQPWREITSSTSTLNLIKNTPYDVSFSTLNLGFMHTIAGFSTAWMGKVLATILVSSQIEEKQRPIVFKIGMLATAVAISDWLNQSLSSLIVTNPTTPESEMHFYDEMVALGAKLFTTIDKTIATLPLILGTAAARGPRDGTSKSLLLALETVVVAYGLKKYFAPGELPAELEVI